MREIYKRYLDACNGADWPSVGLAVADYLLVNGEPLTRADYVARIARVKESFPGYSWAVESFLENGDRIAVRLRDVGTHTGSEWMGFSARGRGVDTTEIATYRFVDGLIADVWTVADNERIRAQLS